MSWMIVRSKVPGPVLAAFQGCGPDFTSGDIDDSQESRVVIRVRQQSQVGGQILDFGFIEEGLATADPVRDPLFAQQLFKGA